MNRKQNQYGLSKSKYNTLRKLHDRTWQSFSLALDIFLVTFFIDFLAWVTNTRETLTIFTLLFKNKSSSKNKSTSKTKFWLVLKIQINWPIFSQVQASKYMFQLALSELNCETWSFPCSINLIMESMLGASHFIGCFHTEDTFYVWTNLGQHL